ncbi:CesT family type III secretion system chaperone [Nitratidesulfovibrio sp. SRB-5]|uniref:CesT family type III secretion system chaperone n=1 Tax=Nitratidesulfovibrio sp. SRB-5 TaxID=2872636 RepID=UPI0010283386|nr:CesT family type III secretion system chaperone [Nitratidesulfovibrio sp. SRB-5]MBZ2170573.1 CesT family type III secretion system chaperone [Nitratidesulfovibrio sp. SRB-5]RXF75738.1 CesT family type III secretion system chaperone [Desulfovibrio sp. DS-1]
MEAIDRVLRDFGARMGMDGLAFDGDGICVLRFDDVTVNLELERDKGAEGLLHAFSVIADLPRDEAQAAAVCRHALEQNVGLMLAGAGAVGLRQPHGLVLANTVGAAGLDVNGLEAFLERQVTVAEGMREAAVSLCDKAEDACTMLMPGTALRI